MTFDRILYTGYFDRGNVGDNAMRDGALGYISQRFPRAKVQTMPLPAFAFSDIGKIYRFMRALWQADALMINGGTYFHDRFGLKSFRILVTFLAMVAVSRLMRRPVFFAGIGMGRITYKWSRVIVRVIFSLSRFVLVRDSGSKRILSEVAPRCASLEGRDLALLLNIPAKATAGSKPKRIGVALAPYFSYYKDDSEGDSQAVEAFSNAVTGLTDDGQQIEVKIFVFSEARFRNDIALSNTLLSSLRDRDVTAQLVHSQDPQEVIERINQCDAFLAVRYHAMLLAHMCGVPTVTFPYEEKNAFLGKELELDSAALIDDATYRSPDKLQNVLRGLLATPELYMPPVGKVEEVTTIARVGFDALLTEMEKIKS